MGQQNKGQKATSVYQPGELTTSQHPMGQLSLTSYTIISFFVALVLIDSVGEYIIPGAEDGIVMSWVAFIAAFIFARYVYKRLSKRNEKFLDAKGLVKKYHLILQSTNDSFARDEKLLPCTKEELRRAHFLVVENLIKNGVTFPKLDPFINSFNRIETFMNSKRANEINTVGIRYREYQLTGAELDGEEFKRFIDYFKGDYLGVEETKKITDFIDRTFRLNGKEGIFVNPSEESKGGLSMDFLGQKAREVIDKDVEKEKRNTKA